jgi:hypothetical protein
MEMGTVKSTSKTLCPVMIDFPWSFPIITVPIGASVRKQPKSKESGLKNLVRTLLPPIHTLNVFSLDIWSTRSSQSYSGRCAWLLKIASRRWENLWVIRESFAILADGGRLEKFRCVFSPVEAPDGHGGVTQSQEQSPGKGRLQVFDTAVELVACV